jgi:phosphatidylinositol glycan class Q protein
LSSFYNNLWLTANDVIVGFGLASMISPHSDWLASELHTWFQVSLQVSAPESSLFKQTYAFEDVRDALVWLNSWPVGLKLNDELGRFLGDAFIWFISAWSGGELLC